MTRLSARFAESKTGNRASEIAKKPMAKVGSTRTSYLRRPPLWADTIIRGRQTAFGKARVRVHAGIFFS